MKFISLHINSLLKSLQLLIKGRYIIYFLPGIIVAILFGLVMKLFGGLSDGLQMVGYIPWVGDELQTGFSFISKWGNFFATFLIQFIILTLFSPINAILSEKLDAEFTGRKFNGGIQRILTDIVRMIGIMIIGIIIQAVVYLLWNITLVKLFNLEWFSPYFLLIMNAFWFGFSFYDFSLERNHIGIGASYSYAVKKVALLVLSGLLFSLLLLIPYIGIVIAPVLLTMVSTFNYLQTEGLTDSKMNKIEA